MTSHLLSFTLPALLCLVNLRGGLCQDWCSVKCRGKSTLHTMCEYKAGGPPSCSGASNGLSEEEKKVIVAYHNELRAKVAKGEEPNQPPASDMHELRWDDEIAEVAQRWIEQCQFKMEHDKCRDTKNGESVGQNLAMKWSSGGFSDRTSTIKSMVRMWYDEVKDFHKSHIDSWWKKKDAVIGHYTQLVWASTTHVGCGLYSKQGEMKLACNYKPAGNTIGQPVYSVGKTASNCKSESKNYPGLCNESVQKSSRQRRFLSNTGASYVFYLGK